MSAMWSGLRPRNATIREEVDSRGRTAIVSAAVVAYHETKFRELTAYDDVTEVMRILHKTGITLGIISSGITLKQAEKIVRLRVHRFIGSSPWARIDVFRDPAPA